MNSPFHRIASRRAVAALSLAFIVCAFIASGPTGGLPRPDDTSYLLQRVYTKGDIDRYKVKSTLNSDGAALGGVKKIVVTMLLKEETKELKPDGAAVLADTFEEATADAGDNNKMDVTSFLPKLTQTRDKQAHTLAAKSEGGSPLMGNTTSQFAQQLIAFYPARPVKVGESWDLDFSDAKTDNPFKIKGKGALVGAETVSGMQTLKIKIVTDTTTEMKDPQTREKIAVATHFDGGGNMEIKSGKIVVMSGKTTVKGGPFTDGDIDWKLKTADDKDDKTTDDKKATADKKAGQ